ncbi:MAG: UPF0280 family protein [Pseudomonadota bacterium]
MTPRIVFGPRTYRDYEASDGFEAFRVTVLTSDLYVKALSRLEKETEHLIRECRYQIEAAIGRRPEFLTSLEPLDEDPADSPAVLRMIRAGRKAGVGPMAAVAGEVAHYVGKGLLEKSAEVIIENGGDLFIHVNRSVLVGLFAGDSPFGGKIGLKIGPTPVSVGVCTSSATIGPSLSLGNADCATIVSRNTALADATATAMGNRVHKPADLKRAVEWALGIPGVDGALALLGDKIAVLGDIELVPLGD